MAISLNTLWVQFEDMFQLIVMLPGIEKVTIQLRDTPTKVYAVAVGVQLGFSYQRCPYKCFKIEY